MPSPDYTAFFAASMGAGAALIGLLFVAIFINPERTVQEMAPWERRTAVAALRRAACRAVRSCGRERSSSGGRTPG